MSQLKSVNTQPFGRGSGAFAVAWRAADGGQITFEEIHVLGESERQRKVRIPRVTRRSSLLDGDLGPEPGSAGPSLAPVRVLRLNQGAIRVKRRNASRRGDELWVGTAYSESGPDNDVPLYLRIGRRF